MSPDDWQATRDRLAENPVAAAVLDLHRPTRFPRWVGALVGCSRCWRHGDQPAPWPCDTYMAVRKAAAHVRYPKVSIWRAVDGSYWIADVALTPQLGDHHQFGRATWAEAVDAAERCVRGELVS